LVRVRVLVVVLVIGDLDASPLSGPVEAKGLMLSPLTRKKASLLLLTPD